jgi:hypothetical protein
VRFFLDTEFIECGPKNPIQLVSLGLVCQNGHELYEVSSEFDPWSASPWVRDNVLIHVQAYPSNPLGVIASRVADFVARESGEAKPEFWGYYADYDWVVFCQIFGTMMQLPSGWPMYCRDIKQFADDLGNPQLPIQSAREHIAINDARWNLLAHNFLSGYKCPA